MSSTLKGYACGIGAAVSYGMNPLGALSLYADGINAMSVLFYRYLTAAIILGGIMAAMGKSFRVSPRQLALLAPLGVLFCMSSITLYFGFLYMDAGVACTILFVYPIIVAALMAIFFHERITLSTIACTLIALAGIALLYYKGSGVTLSAIGVAIVFGSSLSYAIYIVGLNRANLGLSSMRLTFWVLVFGVLTIVAASLCLPQWGLQPLTTPIQWGYASMLGLFPTVLSLVLMVVSVKEIGSTPTAIVGAFEPLTAVVIGVAVFGEAFSFRMAMGIVLILGAVTLLVLSRSHAHIHFHPFTVLKHIRNMRTIILTLLLSIAALFSYAANTVETVEQVSAPVQLTADVDYVITSATPFAASATVDIVNTDNAVVILEKVRPADAKRLLGHIRINGAAATSANTMVKIYRAGSIILPHGPSVKPLTIYSELGRTGDSEQYGAGSRQSLQGKPMNNRARSFTLMRGYMACFATKADGKGYSRVYVADKGNIAFDLPDILQSSISSIRVSQWNDTDKKGYAGNDQTVNAALGTTWCYNWDAGINPWDNREYVTQHHHIGWPSISDTGNNGTSACILANNEPDNTGDDREQVASVKDVLSSWPDMMATGRRLGSPAVSGNYNWLYEFIDSIDARGWRCDFIAVHAYWYSDWSSWKSKLNEIHNRTGRPIWITEMNYGANWTGWPGSNTDGNANNYAIEKQHFAPTIDGLEATPWLERYAVYNWVQDCRKVWDGSKLTPMGEYYAAKESGLAYNSAHIYVPKLPKMKGPDNITVRMDKATEAAHIEWHEYNGEYNRSQTVQRRMGTGAWTDVQEITPQEDAADYAFDDPGAENGCRYRIRVVDASGKEWLTKERAAVLESLEAGDAITVDGVKKYVGGNMFVNGDFDLGLTGYASGDGTPIAAPDFEATAAGSIDDGSYCQAYCDGVKGTAGTVWQTFDIVPGAYYYASMALCTQAMPLMRISFSADGTKEDKSIVTAGATAGLWTAINGTANSEQYTKAIFAARMLKATAGFDKLCLYQLFDTQEEAIADGQAKAAARVAAAAAYIPDQAISEDLLAGNATAGEALQAWADKKEIDRIMPMAAYALAVGMPGIEQADIDAANTATTCADITAARARLEAALAATYSFEEPLDSKGSPFVKNGDFDTTIDWTKCGTYTAGTQGVATVGGIRAWNAKWTGVSAAEGAAQTMAIKQEIANLPHGLYAAQCDAATQHYCLSDQHATIAAGEQKGASPVLSQAVADLPTVSAQDFWQTLTTTPVYVDERGSLTIGFQGSKEGATDNLWHEWGNAESTGDMREGSWSATHFRLLFQPQYRRNVEQAQWGSVCLPRAYTAAQGVQLYKIAAITSDYHYLTLAPVDKAEAGEPCYFYSNNADAVFFESGDETDKALTDEMNLRGFFITSSRVPVGGYALIDGQLVRVPDTASRTPIGYFSAFLKSVVGIPVSDDAAGVRIPIVGAEQEMADGISNVHENKRQGTTYTLGGIANPNAKGIVVSKDKGACVIKN